MGENPRKDAFKRAITEYMGSVGMRTSVPKTALIGAAREASPELFDDSEPCYPGCKNKHAKWRHEFDRAIYDLTQTRPPRIRSDPSHRGHYYVP